MTDTTFDFQQLDIYKKAKFLCKQIAQLIKISGFDSVSRTRLRKSSLDIALHIAESSAIVCRLERRKLLIISRGSLMECMALLELLSDNEEISPRVYQTFVIRLNELSELLKAHIEMLSLKNISNQKERIFNKPT